ncbi:MAG TPA: O-antigen ligase family protein [Kineosporiaceae bacterium]
MTLILLGLALVIVAGFGIALLELTIRRAEVGAALVFLSAVVEAVFVYDVPSVHVSGARVGVTDVVAVTVLGAGLARCLRLRRFGRYQRWLILLGFLLLASLIRGIAFYGIQPSVNDSRLYIFFVGAALYMATFRPSVELYDRIGQIWLIAAVLMMLLACARWLNVFAGIDLGVPAERYGVEIAVRVLNGPYAFFLLGPFILTVPSWLRRGHPRWARWFAALLLVFLMVLDRRTVWAAMLVGVAVLVLRGRRLGPRAVALLVAGSILTAVFFASDVLVRDDSPSGTTSTGSVTWRVEGWSYLGASWSESPVNWIVGRPFGSGFAREVEGSKVVSNPHNFYLEVMIRAGLGGLVAIVALTAGLLGRLWRRVSVSGGAGLFDPSVLPALLATQIIWYTAWSPGLEQGIVTGIAIAVSTAGARMPARRRNYHPLPAVPPPVALHRAPAMEEEAT